MPEGGVSVGTCVEGVIGAGGIVGPDAIDSDGGLGAIGRCWPFVLAAPKEFDPSLSISHLVMTI